MPDNETTVLTPPATALAPSTAPSPKSPANSVVSLGLGILFEGLVELQSNPNVNAVTATRNQFIQTLMELAADIKSIYDRGEDMQGEARTIEELRAILNPGAEG